MIFNELLDRPYAKILWDYNQLHHLLTPADFIFIMCSYNLDVADYAHILFEQGMGKKILLSGGIAHEDDLLATHWDQPEALVFKNRLLDLGMEEKNIITEDLATNCGENVLFSKAIIKEIMPKAEKGLIVQKPYMERRAYATAMKQWPEIEWQVTSPPQFYEDYVALNDEENVIHIMVGDTWRIINYAEKGYQIPQEMAEDVEKALDILINKGYTGHIS